ncbi:hypothetical protein CBS101457_000417 [Exobasidium rhododendri]|nr:hypothetical protein CBS101457_000417 [Exobasidium rhododendri]
MAAQIYRGEITKLDEIPQSYQQRHPSFSLHPTQIYATIDQAEDTERSHIPVFPHTNDDIPFTPTATDTSEPILHDEILKEVISSDAKRGEKTLASRDTIFSGITNRTSSVAKNPWLPGRWAGALIITVVLEAAVVISMVGIVFGMIRLHTLENHRVQDLKTVSVFFSLTMFGMIFIVLIALDANRLKNTIQVIGVTIFNIALLVTAALEISQVRDALRLQDASGEGVECSEDTGAICSGLNDLFPSVEKYLIVVPVVVGIAQIPLTFIAFKLWSEWGWRIYKLIGADINIRRYYLCYQVLVVLLKFDFFFGSGFTMSYLILVVDRRKWEYGITIAAVPVAVLLLFLCAFSARREIISTMILSILCFIAGGVYFIYKITRIYDPASAASYRTVRLTLTFFSIFATLSLLLTLVNAVLCLFNFGKGLRQAHDAIGHLGGHRRQRTNDHKSFDGHATTKTNALAMIQVGKEEQQQQQRQSTDYVDRINGANRLSLD